ncbi:MAG: branched-chain amino acid ABC transporter permease [Thermodesulfobacteriota bacterium]
MSQGQLFVQVILNGIMSGMILMLVVLGLTLVFGILHIVNFAHGEIYMLGAYVFWLLFGKNIISIPGPPVIHYILALIVTMIIIAAFGVLIERLFFKSFRGNLLPSMIISLGIILILQAGALIVFGIQERSVKSVFSGTLNLGGTYLSAERVAVIMAGVTLFVAVYLFIQRTFTGRAMKAVAQDADAAALQGINIDRICSLGMAIGCALAAAAGALLAPIFTINPYIGGEPLLLGFAAIIVGGLGSIPGSIVGSLLIGLVQSFGSTFLDSEAAMIIVFGLLVVMLVLKPTGLWGHEH